MPRPETETLPSGEEKVEAVRSMFDAIAPRYDLVNRIMTLRMDVGWRRKTLEALTLPHGSTVLDLAAGTGDFCRGLADAGMTPVGMDLSYGMLAAARTTAPLVQGDALCLPVPDGSVDGVTCGFVLRTFRDLPPFFAELARVVRPVGRIASLEVAEPANPVMRWGHGIYFGKVVPKIGGLLSDPAAYRYLPKSVAYLPEPEAMLTMLADEGFERVERQLLFTGSAQLITADAHVTPRLTARTVRLDGDVDLLAVAGADGVLFSRNRIGFAGRGVACRIGRAELMDELGAMEVDDPLRQPGTGPVAFGALPFLPGAPAELVVPSLVVGHGGDGTRWVTTVGPVDDDRPDPIAALDALLAADAGAEAYRPGPLLFAVTSDRSPDAWTDAVATATERIAAGELDKVVLARSVTVTADESIPVATVLDRLEQAYPDCYLYLVDGFCGASPELLVGRSGDVVRAQPMAGTAPRRGDPVADARLAANLFASSTYRHEHQVTIDAVHDGLLAFCSYVDYEPEPSVVALANVAHLATSVEGRLSHPPASILELVAALHPTPAVCGRPRDAALAVIADLEELDRDRYAGAVGWVDANGNGQFAVSIRGAAIAGRVAHVVAGNGIVADSDPATELIETRAKLQAMLSAIVRP